jgi:hypothetical protein
MKESSLHTWPLPYITGTLVVLCKENTESRVKSWGYFLMMKAGYDGKKVRQE